MDALGLLAQACSQAVRPGVAAADDHHAFPLSEDGQRWVDNIAFAAAILLGQKLHGKVDALEFAAGDIEVARLLCAAGEQDGVVVVGEGLDGYIDADVGVGDERDSLGAHLLDTAIEHVLFQLEVGDSVAHQTADAVVLFVDGDGVAGAAQLLRGGQARGSAANNGNTLSGVVLGRLRLDPAFLPATFNHRTLDELDGDRRLIDAEDTCGLARRGADAAGELREVVGGVEAANGGLPTAVVDKVVPVGNEVVDRAAGMAKRYAAIHAAGTLLALFFFGKWLVDLEPVMDPLLNLAAGGLLALNLKKAGILTHAAPLWPSPEATK